MGSKVAVVFFAALLLQSPYCRAQAAPGSASQITQNGKTGKVDLLAIIRSTQEGKKAFADVEQQFDPKKDALRRQSDEIVQLRKKLSEQNGTLTDDERKQLSATIESKTQTFLSGFEIAKKDYMTLESSTVERLSWKAVEVIGKYAKANDYSVIFNETKASITVLWVSDETTLKLGLFGKPMSRLQEDVLAAYPAANAMPINLEIIKACDAKAH